MNNKNDPDQTVLQELMDAKSDIAKPHSIDFALYFPTQSAAENAKEPITDILQSDEIRIVPSGYDDYLFEVHKVMVPDLATLRSLRNKLTNVATQFNGTYDGWGAAVED
jgi:hypothetical protein